MSTKLVCPHCGQDSGFHDVEWLLKQADQQQKTITTLRAALEKIAKGHVPVMDYKAVAIDALAVGRDIHRSILPNDTEPESPLRDSAIR
jgi:hypothetical protein